MTPQLVEEREEHAYQAVRKIIDDLTDRGALDATWNEIDEDTQEEIKEKWKGIILQEVK